MPGWTQSGGNTADPGVDRLGVSRRGTARRHTSQAAGLWPETTGAPNAQQDESRCRGIVRESRRTRRNRSEPADGRRRRGVRRWMMTSVDGRLGDTQDCDEVADGPPHVPTPAVIQQLVAWLLNALYQSATLEADTDPPLPSEPWHAWIGVPYDTLVRTSLSAELGDAHGVLRDLLRHTVQILDNLPAQSSRNETLQWLFTSAVWHLKGPSMARAYLELMVLPQIMTSPVGGIPRPGDRRTTRAHGFLPAGHRHDAALRRRTAGVLPVHGPRRAKPTGWFRSPGTEGSNFVALYTMRNGLAIDRRRCFTTNMSPGRRSRHRFERFGRLGGTEILSTLGLEAVCAMFTNGDPPMSSAHRPCGSPRSGPVPGGEQRQLPVVVRAIAGGRWSAKPVDHLSSRGAWRGVNRTSIIVGAAVLASVTVEDPIARRRASDILVGLARPRCQAHPSRRVQWRAGQSRGKLRQCSNGRADCLRYQGRRVAAGFGRVPASAACPPIRRSKGQWCPGDPPPTCCD